MQSLHSQDGADGIATRSQACTEDQGLTADGVRSGEVFTDSSTVLGMLSKDSASFLEFVGNRVSEIKIKSNPETDWFWIPGELNPADMGTRLTVLPADMGPETPYQRGKSWMRLAVRE